MQRTSTFLLRGGLNLVTPPLAIPPGEAISALNYEPDIAGYRSHGGYERFDGRPRPSDAPSSVEAEERRTAIGSVGGANGVGAVRGVQVYQGNVYAFRDHTDGNGRMYRASSAGWEEVTFGEEILFSAGTTEFIEGETLSGGTSTATARIDRVVLQSGAWDGTAAGFLVLSNVSGTFQVPETITSASGSATSASVATAITLAAGGYYDFTTHNFYGGAYSPRLYGANGQGKAWEWDGETLSPVKTGTTGDSDNFLLAANGDFILAANGDSIVLPGAEPDKPMWVRHFANHLFLGFNSGSLINSSLGEPLEYITTTGAGEIAFGASLTGLLLTSTALVVFGHDRVDYLVGSNSSDFLLQPISIVSGAAPRSPAILDTPVYVDDGGIRSLSATAAFGDWRMGTMSAKVEPLLRAKRAAGAYVATALPVKARDQLRLFWSDGTGLIMYVGRKQPELLPFKLPITVFCACTGETQESEGERFFVGAEDGYVYELNRGTSFDGAEIPTYIRLAFNPIGTATQRKVFRKLTTEIDSPDDISIGIAFDVDYARGTGADQVSVSVEAGTPIVSTEDYGSIDWTQPVAGLLEHHIAGIGRNLAVTFVTSASDKEPHTLASATLNFSPRRLVR